jgi:hypothetical protein
MSRNKSTILFIIGVALITSLACSLGSSATPGKPRTLQEPTAAPESTAAQTAITPPAEATPKVESKPKATTQETIPEIPESSQPNDAPVPPPNPEAGACANPLYPMVPGYEWVYEVSNESGTSRIGLTVTEVNGNQATLNAIYLETGVTTETTVECDQGAILNFPLLLLSYLFGDAEGQFDVTYVDGVFSPNYATFVDNDWVLGWEGEYIASGTISANVDGEQYKGTLEDSPIEMKWQTLNSPKTIFDPIEVKAGSFPEAIKIQREIDLEFTAEIEEGGENETLGAVLYLKNYLWYQPNQGLLRQEIQQANIRVFGVRFPLELTSTIELVKFSTP